MALLYRRTLGIEKFYQRHKNLRLNAPAPTSINQQRLTDLTYIRVKNEWHYLSVVLGAFSRKVIGWSLGHHKTAELTLKA
jgi:putative transposase